MIQISRATQSDVGRGPGGRAAQSNIYGVGVAAGEPGERRGGGEGVHPGGCAAGPKIPSSGTCHAFTCHMAASQLSFYKSEGGLPCAPDRLSVADTPRLALSTPKLQTWVPPAADPKHQSTGLKKKDAGVSLRGFGSWEVGLHLVGRLLTHYFISPDWLDCGPQQPAVFPTNRETHRSVVG